MTDTIDPKIKNLLLALLRFDIADSSFITKLTIKEWEEIINIASKQHVKAYLYYNLQQHNLLSSIPEEILKELKASFRSLTLYNMQLLGELNRISKAFKKNDIPVIALKGLHLINSIYPHIGLRYLRDLDILIPKERAKEAYRVAQSLGYYREDKLQKFDYHFTTATHLPQLINKNYHVLEIHSHITKLPQVGINAFWDNAIKQNNNYALFCLEDLILHLSIHISYSDLFKIDIRHYLDIYIILHRFPNDINWRLLKERAIKQNSLLGVYLVFEIISELWDIEIPTEIKFNSKSTNHETTIKNAVEFLWLYDKSSPYYFLYKSDKLVETYDFPLLSRVMNRVFVTKDELACEYDLERSSKKLYLYYFVRFAYLIKTYTLSTLKFTVLNKKKNFLEKTKSVHTLLHSRHTNIN